MYLFFIDISYLIGLENQSNLLLSHVILNGIYGLDKAKENGMILIGGSGPLEDVRQYLLLHLLSAKKHSFIVEKAWQSLRDDPKTAKWGPGGNRQFSWSGFDLKNGQSIPYLFEEYSTGTAEYYLAQGDVMYGIKIQNPQSPAYNNYSMKFYEYISVIQQLIKGVIGDMEYMTSLFIDEPLIESVFDKFFAANGINKFKLNRDFKPDLYLTSPNEISQKIREEKMKFLALILRDYLKAIDIR
jgi:hypothetical protein